MRGRWRLCDPFTVPTRELFAHVLDDFPTARFAFERFGYSLAKLAQICAAAFAAGAGRGIDDALARKVVGQRRGAPA